MSVSFRKEIKKKNVYNCNANINTVDFVYCMEKTENFCAMMLIRREVEAFY